MKIIKAILTEENSSEFKIRFEYLTFYFDLDLNSNESDQINDFFDWIFKLIKEEKIEFVELQKIDDEKFNIVNKVSENYILLLNEEIKQIILEEEKLLDVLTKEFSL